MNCLKLAGVICHRSLFLFKRQALKNGRDFRGITTDIIRPLLGQEYYQERLQARNFGSAPIGKGISIVAVMKEGMPPILPLISVADLLLEQLLIAAANDKTVIMIITFSNLVLTIIHLALAAIVLTIIAIKRKKGESILQDTKIDQDGLTLQGQHAGDAPLLARRCGRLESTILRLSRGEGRALIAETMNLPALFLFRL